MTRIGILSCSNSTQETNCAMVSCLRDVRKRQGFFARYRDDENLELVGIINCAGCPTIAAPQKILKKVQALTSFRLDVLHLTYCFVTLCPFQKLYQKTIAKAWPEIEIVAGTHTPVNQDEFKRGMRELLAPELSKPKDMTDLIKRRLEVTGEPLNFS